MKDLKEIESRKTVLVIVSGALIAFVFLKHIWLLYLAISLALGAVFSSHVANGIHFVWMKLAKILSLIIPNILLSTIFYLILFPLALLSRLFGKKDPLMLKNQRESLFKTTQKKFEKTSFENPW